MQDITLDLRYLACAILVAEHGSFRRAAEVMNLSQSTLSRRIQLLERRLATPLFERDRTGTRPTVAGERFLREAAIGAVHLQQAVNGMASARRGDAGVLRIGLMASLAGGFLSELFETFHRRFPGIEVNLDENTSEMLVAGLLGGRLDIAFIPGFQRLPGCHVELLWEEKVYAVLPNEHALSEATTLDWKDLREETFLVTADAAGPEVEQYLIRKLSEPGFRPRISVQRVGRENLLNMVGKGFGVTLTTCSTTVATYPGLRFREVGSLPDTVGSSVIWSTANTNPALKKLAEIVDHQKKRWNGRCGGLKNN